MSDFKFGRTETPEQRDALLAVNWMADRMVEFSQRLIQTMLEEYPEGTKDGDILRRNLSLLRGTILVSSPQVGAIRSLGYDDTPEGVKEHSEDIIASLQVVLQAIGGDLSLVEMQGPSTGPGPVMN